MKELSEEEKDNLEKTAILYPITSRTPLFAVYHYDESDNKDPDLTSSKDEIESELKSILKNE